MATETETPERLSGRAVGPAAQGRLAKRDERREARKRFVFSLTPGEAAAVLTL